MAKVVIVGAGVAGLTLADKLCSEGISTVLVERETQAGGLARSFRYDTGVFDIGPHRFHTDNPAVEAFVAGVMGENIRTIDRDSQLYLFGKYLPWPITLKSVFALPPAVLLSACADLFVRHKARTQSFEDYIIEKYGQTLYEVFFRPYTEKFLGCPCSCVHRDWAEAGINRATIDKRVRTESLRSLVASVLLARGHGTRFLYPREGGNGSFTDQLAARIRASGGEIILSNEVAELVVRSGRIVKVMTTEGGVIDADHVFWSGSLTALSGLAGEPRQDRGLRYVSTILYNYLVPERPLKRFQWCYVGDASYVPDRVSMPGNFSSFNAPAGNDGVCVEVASNEESELWADPSQREGAIRSALVAMGIVESPENILDLHIEKVRETYPLYAVEYPSKLNDMRRWVGHRWQNLSLLGRTGRFWYNNMDHSISASLAVAAQFASDYKAGDLRDGLYYTPDDRRLL